MGNFTTRREMRQRRKTHDAPQHTGRKRFLATLLTLGIVGTMTLGTTSMAMAADASTEGEDTTTTQVVDTPAEETATTSTEGIDADGSADVAKPVAEPAPVVDNTPSEPVADAPAPDPVVDTTPATVPTETTPDQPDSAARTVTSDDPPIVGGGDYENREVFVCKYVGTPGVDERLKGGQNPISVSVNAIQHNSWDGTVPGWFSDAHDRSYVLGYDNGQPTPDISNCPGAEEPPPFDWNWQYPAPTCDGLTVSYPNNIPAGSNNKDVNIRVKNLVTGEVKTFNFHDSDFVTRGKTVTYAVTAHADWPGWTYYEVQWTQVHGTNYHWEGSIICGTSPPEPPTCVENPTWSYTFDGVGSGTVTASSKDAEQGDELCDALAVRAATYEYDRPASGNPSWPQTPYGTPNDVLVDSIGTFSYAAPALDTCRQHDVYAEFVSKGGFDELSIPEKLYGPNNPYEPQFLHQALAGKGPNPTYSTTTSDGCNTPPAPEVVTGTGEFETLSCTEGAKNWATLDAVPGGVWTFTDKNGATYKTATGEGYSGSVPGGLAYGDIVVSLDDTEDTMNGPSGYDVTPWSDTWTTVDPESLDCNVETEPEVTTGTATFETLSCTEDSKNWAATDTVKGGVWIFLDKNEERFVTKSGEGYTGGIPEDLAYGTITVELRDGDATDNYEVTPWDGTWTTVDPASLKCDTDVPPTDNPPTDNPPVNNPPAQNPPANNPPSGYTPTGDKLAMTGADVNGALTLGGLLLLAGAVLMVVRRRRQAPGQL